MTIADSCTPQALFSTTDQRPDGGEWETPSEFFKVLDEEFHFTLDACATPQNAKCPNFYTKEQDALKQDWFGVVWCNPPYGRHIGDWLAKGRQEASKGATVVFLIPARVDTHWFHQHVYHVADEVRFIKGRLRFEHKDGLRTSAPFPSMLVVYRPKTEFCTLEGCTCVKTERAKSE